jgi:thioredoxin reductase (NADPH)
VSPAEKLVIIGGACAGYTSAIYASRASLSPVVFIGDADGGQLAQTTEVENFPGFPDGVMGPELMMNFRRQAEKFGARLVQKGITAVDFSVRPFSLNDTEGGVTRAQAVIIATGAQARWLNIPSEQALRGRGVSACATCDGFFFRGKAVAVVGGGDTAVEEATFLTKFASMVTIIHRRDALRASKAMQDRARANPKIAFVWDSVVEEVLGNDKVAGLRLKNVKTGAVSDFPCQGLFLGIGHEPSTGIFRGQVELDAAGYVVTRDGTTATSVPGVFAGGDVRDPRYRQAISAAGSGCMAAIDAERWLGEQGM